eukprot:NODE_3356_length_993_cov_17.047669_g3084_i0.p1 GENE.NODE_3356_length_993_cov_17.047669_g3084_i0~~NODE_3356_length_993_cov_17.047669_g3084_i0.p1  ORF type:complete len:206 (+),score=52.26 NODE_3356_length_993_cov_17.047669_g3084_i0:125-742(+)
MSKKRGLSPEEKIERTKDYLLEKQEPFTLKELERLLPKAKGIIFNSVKQCVETLVADGVVECDKIGANTFYWALPSAQGHARVVRLQQRVEALGNAKRKLAALAEQVAAAEKCRAVGEDRTRMLETYSSLQAAEQSLDAELQAYHDNDPALLERLEESAELAKDAANRWTEAIFGIQKMVRDQFCVETEKLNKEFGIPEDLDYVS